MRLFGPVQKRDNAYSGQRMLKMELPGLRKRRPWRMLMDVEMKDIQWVGVTEEDVGRGNP